MAYLPLILGLWTASVTAFVIIIIYRGHLTRQEVDVVFLDEATDAAHEAEHDDIVRRVDRLGPLLRILGVTVAVCTVAIIAIYMASLHY